jgi:hypothetical protein
MLLINTARLFRQHYSGNSSNGKGKGKVRPTACHEGKEGE